MALGQTKEGCGMTGVIARSIGIAAIAVATTAAPARAWEFSQRGGDENVAACTAETIVNEIAVGFKASPGREMWAYADGFAGEGEYKWEISGAESYALENVWSTIHGGVFIAQNIPLPMFRDVMSGESLTVRSETGQSLEVSLQGAADAVGKFIACYTGLATLGDYLDRGPGGTFAAMFLVAGECKLFHIASESQDCAPATYRTAYDTGAFSFSGSSEEQKLAVAFVGKSGVRKSRGKLIQSIQMLAIQPLDGKQPTYTAANGSCTYDGFMGKGQETTTTNIACFATDGDGRSFILNFEKNATPPRDVTN
jgi:hypothetical protein